MGSLIKKKNKSGIYYSYVESKRIDGKPTMVNMKYLGTADSILEKTRQEESSLQDRVLYSDIASFGDVALIYDIASRLGLVQMIDAVVPKRKQGASIGQYLWWKPSTARLHRLLPNTSKNGTVTLVSLI